MKIMFNGDNDHFFNNVDTQTSVGYFIILWHVSPNVDVHVIVFLSSIWKRSRSRPPCKTVPVSFSWSCTRKVHNSEIFSLLLTSSHRSHRSRGPSGSCSAGSRRCRSSCLRRSWVSSRSICRAPWWPEDSWTWGSSVSESRPTGQSVSRFPAPLWSSNSHWEGRDHTLLGWVVEVVTLVLGGVVVVVLLGVTFPQRMTQTPGLAVSDY